MPTAKKEAAVQELQEMIQGSTAVFLTDYRGLSVAALTNLRRQLRETNAEYAVAKNTLTSIAAERAGVAEVQPLLEGPTALAFAFGDPSATAKVINDFARTSRILTVRAGLLNNRVLSAEDVTELANLEPREVLLARLLGGFNSPIASFVGVLNASISQIAYLLQARIDQMGGSEAAPAAAE